MLSKKDKELLTRVGPGRPMGELMRVFRDPAVNRSIPLPLEQVKFHVSRRPERYRPAEAGFSAAAGEMKPFRPPGTWRPQAVGDPETGC